MVGQGHRGRAGQEVQQGKAEQAQGRAGPGRAQRRGKAALFNDTEPAVKPDLDDPCVLQQVGSRHSGRCEHHSTAFILLQSVHAIAQSHDCGLRRPWVAHEEERVMLPSLRHNLHAAVRLCLRVMHSPDLLHACRVDWTQSAVLGFCV